MATQGCPLLIDACGAKGVQSQHSVKINRIKALDVLILYYLPPHWNLPKPSIGKIA
jgi:hypothetical protein